MIQIVDDDIAPAIEISIRDDDTGSVQMAIKAINEGGTGRDKTSDGPGFVIQASTGANLTTLASALGALMVGGTSGVPTAFAPNNTSTRKFLMQVATIADMPVFDWVQVDAADIASGILPIGRGGLGVDLTEAGPGMLVQDSFGANLSLLSLSNGQIPMGAASPGGVDVIDANGTSTLMFLSQRRLAGVTVTGFATVSSLGIPAAASFSLSPRLIHTGGLPPRLNTDGTDATPVNTEVYIAEVEIDANVTVSGVANFNGSVVSGNLQVALADSTGAIVATSASTAMAGTDTQQKIPFTTPYAAKGPATYYVLVFVDNSTARINCHTFGTFGAAKQTGQVYASGFTAITPPTTFTAGLGPIASLY